MSLVENFSWLIYQLNAFDDPSIRYSHQGMPGLRGGKRREYRKDNHIAPWKDYTLVYSGNEDITFGLTSQEINVDKYDVTHIPFIDATLKEKYPKPEPSYTVMVTSEESFYDNTATRYYVSCNCMDFKTTFESELSSDEYGYTNATGSVASKGTKKQAPAICKHILAVLYYKYDEILRAEKGIADPSAVIDSKMLRLLYKHISSDDSSTLEDLMTDDDSKEEIIAPADTGPLTPSAPSNTQKEQYEKQIRKTLKFLNNLLSNNPAKSYKNARATTNSSTSFKKYKFSVKKYPQGWVIVFSNPEMNIFLKTSGTGISDKKEIVPIFTRSGNNFKVGAHSPVIVYTKYFTKDELMAMIREETKELQQSQIDYLTKRFGKLLITEGLVADADSITATFMEFL